MYFSYSIIGKLQLSNIAPTLSHSLLVTLEYAQHEMPGPPFCVDENEVQNLFRNTCDIELLFAEDILSDNDNFNERGLSSLVEKVYRLSTSQNN